MSMTRGVIFIFLMIGMAVPATGDDVSAVTPVPGEHRRDWMRKHTSINDAAKMAALAGPIDLLFVGDSITDFWSATGKHVWAERYAHRNAVNAGIDGDRTQHVLWRLDHGNVDEIKPKVTVVMIGTNNFIDNTAEEIAEGVVAVAQSLREKLPDTKILLLAIFPRGEGPSKVREKLASASARFAKVADGDKVHYLDIGDEFLEPDGTLTREVMWDLLHLTVEGYRRWADALEDKIDELVK